MDATLTLVEVDYTHKPHIDDLFSLLQMYANDSMGGGEPIHEDVLASLPKALASRTFMHSFIVYEQNKAVAFANCIESFSTFTAKGVMNIHDFAVMPDARGKGISQFLMEGIQKAALTLGCTKLTLEVLTGNESAIRAYQKAGFSAYQLTPELGDAMFWQKYI